MTILVNDVSVKIVINKYWYQYACSLFMWFVYYRMACSKLL